MEQEIPCAARTTSFVPFSFFKIFNSASDNVSRTFSVSSNAYFRDKITITRFNPSSLTLVFQKNDLKMKSKGKPCSLFGELIHGF